MDISGSYTFDAPPDRVWALLMDPAVISSCIPGCDGFEPAGENSYRVTLTVALAAITGTYEGTVTLSDLCRALVVPPDRRRAGKARVREGQLRPSRCAPTARRRSWTSPARCRRAARSPGWASA